MELEVLGSRGIPQNSLISVTAGSVRKQVQLSDSSRSLRFPIKADDHQIKVDVLDVLGRGRLPVTASEQKYTLPIDPETNALYANMEVDVVVRPCAEEDIDKEDIAKDEQRKDEASRYLEEHGLTTYMQYLLHSVMQAKPADPYSFLQKQLAIRTSGQGIHSGDFPLEPSSFPALEAALITMAPGYQEGDPAVQQILETLSPTQASRMRTEEIMKLEREAEDARRSLMEDNEKLRDTATQMNSEYDKLMKESSQLQEKLEAKRKGKMTEAQNQTVEAYGEIEKLQDDVKQLAKDNAALVSKLARGRQMIDTVKQEMAQIQKKL